MARSPAPEIIELSAAQLEELLAKLTGLVPTETYQLLEKLLRTLQWLLRLIQSQKTTISRLNRLLFGAKTEKTKQLFPPATDSQTLAGGSPPTPKRKGHGRTPAAGYTGAKRVKVTHPNLRPGALCPDCHQGKLYTHNQPGQLVRINAQPIFTATHFELEALRCARCGALFTAPPPPEAGTTKYAPQVGFMLGYLRFGGGVPHYRLEKIQKDFGVRLPASTQWELMARGGKALEPVHEALLTLAAQGSVLHNKC
jgi:hypothetical protein